MSTLENVNLTGHLLIAMPGMTDPFFSKSVTFICTHNQDGAMGVMINRPTDLSYETLFEKIKVDLAQNELADNTVLYGGPVQPERGFVLHEHSGEWDSTLSIAENTALTTSKDILESVAIGTGPKKMLLALGYAGWTAGQLEQDTFASHRSRLSAKHRSPRAFFCPDIQRAIPLDARGALMQHSSFSLEICHHVATL